MIMDASRYFNLLTQHNPLSFIGKFIDNSCQASGVVTARMTEERSEEAKRAWLEKRGACACGDYR